MSIPAEGVAAILRRTPVGPVSGVEVGVFRGQLSAVLLRSRPDLFLVMVDSWLGQEEQPAAYRATRDHHSRETAARQAQHQRTALAATAFAESRRRVIVKPSVRAAQEDVPPESQDFVFLDGDHSFEGVTCDIEAWWPALKVGGWMYGDDYSPNPNYDFGVGPAVDAAVAAHGWDLTFDGGVWFVQKREEARSHE